MHWRIARTNASTEPAGTSQPCAPGCTNSGMPAINVVTTGLRSAIASIMTIGRPSAKLGRINALDARSSARTSELAQPPCDAHSLTETEALDLSLYLGSQLTIPGKHQFKIDTLLHQLTRSLKQQQVALLLGKSTNADQTSGRGQRHRRMIKELRIQSARHDVNPGPSVMRHEAIELATAVRADGGHKGGRLDLLGKMKRTSLVELFGAMHREAPGWPTQFLHHHRDFGGIGAEMRMQMLDVGAFEPAQYPARFRNISEMRQQPAFGSAAHAPCELQGSEKSGGSGECGARGRQQKWPDAFPQDIARQLLLCPVLLVWKRLVPAAHRDPDDVHTLALQRPNLAADEAVADLWILIDKIGNAHRQSLVLNQQRLTPQKAIKNESDLAESLGKAGQHLKHGKRGAIAERSFVAHDLAQDLCRIDQHPQQCPRPEREHRRHACERQHQSPKPGPASLPDPVLLRTGPMQIRALSKRVSTARGSLEPLAKTRHGGIVKAHLILEPPNFPPLHSQPNAEFRFFASDQRIPEAVDRDERVDTHHRDTTTSMSFPRRSIPFAITEPVVDRPVRISLAQPSGHRCHVGMPFEERSGLLGPAVRQHRVSVDELDELHFGCERKQLPQAGVAGARSRERNAHVELDDRCTRVPRQRHRTVSRSGIDIYSAIGILRRLNACSQPRALVPANDHRAEVATGRLSGGAGTSDLSRLARHGGNAPHLVGLVANLLCFKTLSIAIE